MKKILSIVLAAFLSTAIFAQETESKDYLPKSGDISIGLNATPFLNYAGNILNGTVGNTLNLTNQTIYGRYYIADDAAVTFDLNVNNTTNVDKDLVDDIAADVAAAAAVPPTTSDKTVEDVQKVKNNRVTINAGYIKFRGNGRLRGFYGGKLMYQYAKLNIIENTWGNEINGTTQGIIGATSALTARTISQKPNATSTIGLSPVIGVEYYIAPKICIGVELNLMWAVTMSNNFVERTSEYWDAGATTPARVEETTVEDESVRNKSYDRQTITSTGTAGGNLYVMFSF